MVSAMAIRVPRGNSDAVIEQIKSVLHSYQEDHPAARIDLYRQNPASVRIRIIDPNFAGMSRVDRHARVWKYLDQLPEEDEGDISMLVLLTPDETSRSTANLEFEDPVPSLL
jgi:stress-induced morphogen